MKIDTKSFVYYRNYREPGQCHPPAILYVIPLDTPVLVTQSFRVPKWINHKTTKTLTFSGFDHQTPKTLQFKFKDWTIIVQKNLVQRRKRHLRETVPANQDKVRMARK